MSVSPTLSRRRTIGLMVGLMMGVLLALMDQTVVSTALPTIAGQLGRLDLYAWVFSAYMLAQTSFLTIFGKLSDLYGQRRMFLLGTVAFMLGSALCGQARSMEQLVLFRGLQGIGGAGLMPTALAILGVHFEPRQRARLQGILGSAGAIAVIVGPTVGSLIVENVSWRWVFYVNLPLGLLSALFVTLSLREATERNYSLSIDYAGALALIGWVVSLMLAFVYSRDYPWLSLPVLGLLAAFALLFAFFLLNERRSREPILPLAIFSHPTVAAASAVTFIRAVAMYSLIIYVPLLVQGVLGGTPEVARNALTLFALPGIVGAAAAGLMVARNVGYRTLMVAGLMMSGVGMWSVSRMTTASGEGELLAYLALAGLGIGLTQVTIVLALQNSVTREHMGTASSLSQFLNNLAGTVGVSLLGSYQVALMADRIKPILASPEVSQLSAQAGRLLADTANLGGVLTNPAIATRLPQQLVYALRAALDSSLDGVFQVGVALTAAALLVSLFMRGSAASASVRAEAPPLSAMRHGDGAERLDSVPVDPSDPAHEQCEG